MKAAKTGGRTTSYEKDAYICQQASTIAVIKQSTKASWITLEWHKDPRQRRRCDDEVVGDRRQVPEAVTMIDKSKRGKLVLNG